jgi:XisI protein
MENKIDKYQSIIVDFLKKQAKNRIANTQLENQLVFDTVNHHYQLLRIGFRDNHFVHACPFHFDIKNGKIWIQQNRTDIEVGQEFQSLGVPASDIVIGFLPEKYRAMSDYAVS